MIHSQGVWRKMLINLLMPIGLLLLCFLTNAQQTSSDVQQSDIYYVDFFNQYTPQNALDMVKRLPGFKFDSGSNARGFGVNAGNVLIDGVRPVSKSGGLEGSLLRIMVSQVVRIEILRGIASAGEAQGQSVVANVVLNKTNSRSGRWALKYRQLQGANPEPNLEWALSTQLAEWDTSWDADIGGSPNYRTAVIDTVDDQAELLNSNSEILVERSRWAYANALAATALAGGKLTLTGNLGKSLRRSDFERQIYLERMPEDNDYDVFSEVNDRSDVNEFELGVDWTKNYDRWKWRILGLTNQVEMDFSSEVNDQFNNSDQMLNVSYDEQSVESEHIVRSTMSLITQGKVKPEFGIELAKNKLDKKIQLAVNNESLVLGNDDVVVEEHRIEAFANVNYNVDPQLSIEAGVTLEVSQIDVNSIDADNSSLFYFKPRFAATYIPHEAHSIGVEVERRVGQLDFESFVASSNTVDNNSNAGNSNLQPDKTDELAISYEWGFAERGNFKVKAYYQWRRDVLEHIVLNNDPDNRTMGYGNAGDGHFLGLTTRLNLPLDWILPNGLLEFQHLYRDSELDDPIIDASRHLNFFTDISYDLVLRQDLVAQQITWGVTYYSHFLDTSYRVDEFHSYRGNNRTNVFIETHQFFDMKIRLDIANTNTGQFTRTRQIYYPDRGGQLQNIERARRYRKPLVTLSLSGLF